MLGCFAPPCRGARGGRTDARVAKTATVGAGAALGPHSFSASGSGSAPAPVLTPGVYVGDDVVVGEDCSSSPTSSCASGSRWATASSSTPAACGVPTVSATAGTARGTRGAADRLDRGRGRRGDRPRACAWTGQVGTTKIGRGTKIDTWCRSPTTCRSAPCTSSPTPASRDGEAGCGSGDRGGQVAIRDHVTIGRRRHGRRDVGGREDVPAKAVVRRTPALPHARASAAGGPRRLPTSWYRSGSFRKKSRQEEGDCGADGDKPRTPTRQGSGRGEPPVTQQKNAVHCHPRFNESESLAQLHHRARRGGARPGLRPRPCLSTTALRIPRGGGSRLASADRRPRHPIRRNSVRPRR